MSGTGYTDWRKSTHSNVNTSQCVETASGRGTIAVRDTTDRDGGTLNFTPEAWAKFVAGLK